MEQSFDFDGAYRASLGNENVSTQMASGTAIAIKEMLRTDPEFFIDFFIHDELVNPVPQIHKEIWGLLTDEEKERILLAIPRGHNKTTLAKLAVVWHFLFTRHRFCVYLSNTNNIAKNAVKDILAYMQSDNFVSVFGRIDVYKSSETDSLWQFRLPMGNGQYKNCILRAVGAGQQVRGLNIDNQRPDLAVVDDVEDLENTDSDILQAKLDRWMFGPFLKALAKPRRKVIWLGNMLKKTSLLARLSRNPVWNPVVFGALLEDSEGNLVPLWPDLWSVEELRADFIEHKGLGLIESWMCEMMNMPGHGENGFTDDQMKYAAPVSPGECESTWITIDPAFGENAHNDKTAIVVHGIPIDTGIPQVLAYYHGKCDEIQMFEEAWALTQYWGCYCWGIESVAAQKVLITLFQLLAVNKLIDGLEFVPLMAGSGDPKVARIRAYVALMASGEYFLTEGDLEATTQFLEYNMKKKSNKDDLIDSISYGPQMMNLYMHTIRDLFNGTSMIGHNSRHATEVEGA